MIAKLIVRALLMGGILWAYVKTSLPLYVLFILLAGLGGLVILRWILLK